MSDFFNDISQIKQKSSTLKTNKVARFSYTQTAYDNDEIAGVDTYQYTNEQNVPKDTKTDLAPTVIDKGVRSQSASLPRNAINHFFGRVSYNLNKITDWLDTILAGLLRSEAMNGHRYTSTTKYKQYDVCSFVDTTITPNQVRYFMRYTSDPVELSNYPPMVGSTVQTTHWQELSDIEASAYSLVRRTSEGRIKGIIEKAVNSWEFSLQSVSSSTTLQLDSCVIEVTTANAVTLTIPSGLSIGHQYRIKRTVSSANGISVATSGSETIEGTTSFTARGTKVSAMLDTGEVVLEKVSSTAWAFVGGQISGSNSNGTWVKFSDGTMMCWGNYARSLGATIVYGTGTFSDAIISFPASFINTDYSLTAVVKVPGRIILTSLNWRDPSTTSCLLYYFDPLSATVYSMTTEMEKWLAIGRWK